MTVTAELHPQMRVIYVFSTGWYGSHCLTGRLPKRRGDQEEFGSPEEFYSRCTGAQLPTVIMHHDLDPAAFVIRSTEGQVEPSSLQAWLFVTPSDGVVAAVAFDLPHAIDAAIGHRLRKALNARLCWDIAGRMPTSLSDCFIQMARSSGVGGNFNDVIAPSGQRYQLILVPQLAETTRAKAVVDRLLDRPTSSVRVEWRDSLHPQGHTIEGAFAAIDPEVGVLYGCDGFAEWGTLMATVQAVGVAASTTYLASDVARALQSFRDFSLSPDVGVQRREDFEELLDRLGNFELALGFDVEYPIGFGLMLPSATLRQLSQSLFEVMGLSARARKISEMLVRIKAGLDSEFAAIDIREKRKADEARLRWAPARVTAAWLGALSAIAGLIAVMTSVLGLPSPYAVGLSIALPAVAFTFHYAYRRKALPACLQRALNRRRRWS